MSECLVGCSASYIGHNYIGHNYIGHNYVIEADVGMPGRVLSIVAGMFQLLKRRR